MEETTMLFSRFFLFFLTLKVMTQFYLILRNASYVQRHRHQVPDLFKDKITLEEHQKAANYTMAKSKSAQIFLMVDFWIILFWCLGGGLQKLHEWSASYQLSPIKTGVLLFFVYGLISSLIDLPQSLYETFIVEEKFGFNKTTLKLFFVDLLKGLVLSSLIGLPFLALILSLVYALPNSWWVWGWVSLTLFQLLLLWIYPTFLAPFFNKFSPLPEGPLKEKVLDLLKRIGFEASGLFVMDASKRSSHGNAYFTGLGKQKRIVFFDTLLKDLHEGEVEAILAHELGHYKKKHILKSLLISTVLSFCGFFIVGKLIDNLNFFESFNLYPATEALGLLLFSLIMPSFSFFMTPCFSYLSRKNEFEADDFASLHSKASDLISGLVKLYKENANTLTPDPLYSFFYHSHPPALERVKHLAKQKT
jgi:STE24 endopeptidase